MYTLNRFACLVPFGQRFLCIRFWHIHFSRYILNKLVFVWIYNILNRLVFLWIYFGQTRLFSAVLDWFDFDVFFGVIFKQIQYFTSLHPTGISHFFIEARASSTERIRSNVHQQRKGCIRRSQWPRRLPSGPARCNQLWIGKTGIDDRLN